MKKFNRLVAVFTVLLLIGTMVGCSKTSNTSSKDTIKIGLNLELSGAVAEYGQKGQNGAMLAIEDQNKKGGVLGKQVEAVALDNKSDNAESASVAASLAGKGIVGYIGCMTTGRTLAYIPVSEQYKLPLISPTGTAADVTVDSKTGQVRPYAFRACFLDPFQGQVMSKFAIGDLKAKTAAILMDTSNDYSKGLAEAFETNFKAAGGTIVDKEAYIEKDKDFKPQLTKIKASNPDVIFVPGYYNEVGLIVKQGRELGITAPFTGGDGWGSPQLVQIAGADALTNTYFCNHFSASSTDPKVQAFVQEFKTKYGTEPDGFAALGYDAAMLMMDAVQRAGSTDTAKITAALAATSGFQGVAGAITMDSNHNPVKSAVIIGFDNGKEVVKSTVNP